MSVDNLEYSRPQVGSANAAASKAVRAAVSASALASPAKTTPRTTSAPSANGRTATAPPRPTPIFLQVLDGLDSSGRHDLTAIDPKGAIETATFLPHRRKEMTEWIDARQGQKNLYVSVNEAASGAPRNSKLKKNDIGSLRAIVIDLDPKKIKEGDPSGDNFRRERDRLAKVVAAIASDAECPPTLLVDSGGGYQAWWQFDKKLPATPENVELVEGIGRALQQRFGGDAIWNSDRIMRLPDTINVPTPEKQKQGRSPAPAEIIKGSTGLPLTIDKLQAWAPPVPAAAKVSATASSKINMGLVGAAAAYEDLPPDLRAKFERHRAADSRLQRLWDGDRDAAPGDDASCSGFRFALATILRRTGDFSATEHGQLVWIWDHGHNPDKALDARAIARDWDRTSTTTGAEDFGGDGIVDIAGQPSRPAQSDVAASDWAEPADLWADESDPVDLPAGVVPEIIEAVARDQACRLGVEAGAPAAALITSMASLVSAGNEMQIRQHDTGWTVKPIIWTCLIGEPGSNKTATLGYATAPVGAVEAKWKKEYAAARRTFEVQTATDGAKARANTAAAPIYRASDAGTRDAAPSQAIDKPPLARKMVFDSTTEKLAEILSKNPGGLLYFSDEIAGLFGSMDAYHQKAGKDRPFWLQAKEGKPYSVDRRSSDTIHIENLAISVLGGVQPAKMKGLSVGLSDDGMLQRFLPVIIKSTGEGADVAPDKDLATALPQLAFDLVDSEQRGRFRFSPDADKEYRDLESFKRREIAQPKASSAMRQWIEKMPNEFGRLALIFHFIEWHSLPLNSMIGETPPELVSAETARRARRFLMEFVYLHATAFHNQVLGLSTTDENARWVAGYILSRGLLSIQDRDIYRSCPALKGKDKRGEIADVMRVLEMEEWARPDKYRAGKPTAWIINPAAHATFAKRAEAERARREAVQGAIQQDAARRRSERAAAQGGE